MPLAIFGADAAVSLLNRAFTNSSPSNALFNNQVSNAKSLLPAGANASNSLSYVAFAKEFGAAYANQTADALSTLLLTNMGLLPNADLQTGLKDYITANGVGNIGIIALQLGGLISTLESATGDLAVYNAAAKAWNAEVTDAFTYSINPASTTTLSGNDATAPVVTTGQTFTYAENQAKDFAVGTVKATDLGEGGKAGTISKFEITTGNTDGFFAIDATTGAITLTEAGAAAGKASNDYETAPNTFKLGVVATDAAGNKSTAGEVTINVTDVDDTAPKLVAATAAGTTVKLNFDESLKAAALSAGAFTVVDAANASITVNSVAVSGSQVTLVLAATPSGAVKVSYTAPATGDKLQDAAGNAVAAISSVTASTDVTAPTLASSSPTDDSVTFGIASNLTLTFSETVVLGTGNITIVNAADATDTRTIAVTDSSQVTVSGTTVTVNPTADLKAGAAYYVNVPATAVLDAAGNVYAGISNATTLNFTAVSPTAIVPGQTFLLTVAADNIAGTTGDDMISGATSATAAENTMTIIDVIDGGAGTDTLQAILNGAGFPTGMSVKNVEKVSVKALTANNADLSGITGIKAVESNGSLNNTTITLDNNATIGLLNSAKNVTVVLKDASVATTGATVNLEVAAAGTSTTVRSTVTVGHAATAGTGTDTVLAINASSGSSFITYAEGGNAVSTDFKALNISGAGKLDLDVGATILNNTTTVDASANTGGATLTLLGNAKDVTVTGGSGNDKVTLPGFTVKDVVNLGAGTDTLSITLADALLITETAKVTNTEVLELTGATAGASTVNAALFGVTSFTVAGAIGHAVTLTNIGNGGTVTLTENAGAAVAVTLDVKGAIAGTADTLTLTTDKDGADLETTLITTKVAGVETLTIAGSATAGAGAFKVGAIDSAALKTIVITNAGGGAVSVSSLAAATAVTSIDASAAVGATTISGANSVAAVTFKGGSKIDTYTASAKGDLITGGAGADVITLGAGADKLFYTAATDSTATATDVVGGFSSNDLVSFAANLQVGTASYLGAAAFNASANFTQLRMNGANLEVDFGGDGVADLVVTLTGVTSATFGAANFTFA